MDGLGLRYGTVDVVPHDPRWLTAGARLCASVLAHLGPLAVDCQHVGSTSVPGLAAKPIVDLGADGGLLYVLESSPGVRVAHAHAVPYGSPAWIAYLRVRDKLRSSPSAASAYAALKRDLAARFPADRAAYTAAKTDFIAAL